MSRRPPRSRLTDTLVPYTTLCRSDVQQVFVENIRVREEQRARYAALRDEPAVSLDGIELALHINAGLQIDVEHVAGTGAAGIGLYPTEVPFMVRDRFPDVPAQTELSRRIIALAGDRPARLRPHTSAGGTHLPY